MKKVVLVAVNTRYVHVNLAVRLLKSMMPENTQIVESTLQEPIPSILSRILIHQPQAVGFSGYLWNKEIIFKLVDSLKALSPELIIFLGGPEFSYEGQAFLAEHPEVDFLILGEGERVYRDWAYPLGADQ